MEMRELRQQYREAVSKYRRDHWDKLQSYLNTCGFSNVDVVLVKTGDVGRLQVVSKSYDSTDPCDIKFYKYKKSGELSQVAHGQFAIYMWDRSDEEIMKQLKEQITLADGGAEQ